MLSSVIEKLKGIAIEQQKFGTQKLILAGVVYDDGTIQGVMENIPKGGSDGNMSVLVAGIAFSAVPALDNVYVNGQEV